MGWGLAEVKLWEGNHIIIFFSFLYIAVPHTAHAHYVSYHISIVSCHICLTFLNMIPLT